MPDSCFGKTMGKTLLVRHWTGLLILGMSSCESLHVGLGS